MLSVVQAAVAVRSAPGSSLLKDVALLHAGDTFGELCLLVGGLCQQQAAVQQWHIIQCRCC